MDSSETFPHLSFRRADIKSQVMPDARISCVELSKGCIYINGGMHNTSAPPMNYPQDSDWWNREDKISLHGRKRWNSNRIVRWISVLICRSLSSGYGVR